MKMLKQEELEYPNCQDINRIQMCYDEHDAEGAHPLTGFGPGFHLRDMLTQNFLVADGERSAKTMVNVGGLPVDYVENLDLLKDGNVHEPAPGYCQAIKAEGWEFHRDDALFTAHHFPGTEEQRFSRVNDLRGNTPWVSARMKHECSFLCPFHSQSFWPRLTLSSDILQRGGTKRPNSTCPNITANDIQPWLQGFVGLVGRAEAERLLEGVGQTGIWSPFNASTVYVDA